MDSPGINGLDRQLDAHPLVKMDGPPEAALAIDSRESHGFIRLVDQKFQSKGTEQFGFSRLHEKEIRGKVNEPGGIGLGKRYSPFNGKWIGREIHASDLLVVKLLGKAALGRRTEVQFFHQGLIRSPGFV